jgi:gliding motility-associated-like protein
VITPSTGVVGTQIAVTDVTTSQPYKSLNGVGLVNTDGYAYAQYQAIPNRTQVLLDLLAGNYTATSSLIQIGSNGKAQTLGILTPPANAGFNAHVMLGLLGSADNTGNYLVASAEAQVNPVDTSISAFKLYIGKVSVPSASVTWSEISLDVSCTAFQQAFIDAIKRGEDRGAQDMVWDYNTNKLLLYAGVDRILGVLDLTSNVGTCYADNNGVQQTANLGGLALDSVGQLIGLEVQSGRVFRIDTRGCVDGNPGTPCVNSVTSINNYTINGNIDTRGDAASCVSACTPPVITKSNAITCVNTPIQLSVGVSPQGNNTYTWGIYAGNGTFVNTNTATPTYANSVTGNFKVYVTVENATGCQATDSLIVTVVNKPDTTFLSQSLCSNKNDSIIFNGQIIKDAGVYLVSLISNTGCDSLVKLTVTENVCNTNPPVAVADDTITFGNSIVINVLNNDYDLDGDTISICGIVTNPTHGSIVTNQDGTITYTPNITSGIDSFQYKICTKDGDSIAWVVITIEDCIIPNTFSPNGDGKNDIFEIPCIDANKGSLCVFNRWGAQVFRNDHYDNITGTFDGKYKGEDLPDGTYYYVLKYNNLQGKSIDRAGFIVIHRASK